jgi:hypothetical protein
LTLVFCWLHVFTMQKASKKSQEHGPYMPLWCM